MMKRYFPATGLGMEFFAGLYEHSCTWRNTTYVRLFGNETRLSIAMPFVLSIYLFISSRIDIKFKHVHGEWPKCTLEESRTLKAGRIHLEKCGLVGDSWQQLAPRGVQVFGSPPHTPPQFRSTSRGQIPCIAKALRQPHPYPSPPPVFLGIFKSSGWLTLSTTSRFAKAALRVTAGALQ